MSWTNTISSPDACPQPRNLVTLYESLFTQVITEEINVLQILNMNIILMMQTHYQKEGGQSVRARSRSRDMV